MITTHKAEPQSPQSQSVEALLAQAPRELASGRYTVHDVLGIGGMATVYKAWDSQLAVFRAVKVLSPQLANRPAIRSRFLTEARAMARLRHPYVVSIQDVIDADGQIFIVMDLIAGGTAWEQVVRDGPRAELEAVRLLAGIAAAVQAAHDEGIVHRDIKPQNILLTESGDGRLTDFGIARFDDVSDRRAETRTGTVMGTWGFMPPEQRNDSSRVGPRSDVYAMGATLWSLVRGSTPTDLFMADREPEMLEGFSPALAKIVMRSTRYRPDDRYASAGDFATALEAITRDLNTETIFPGVPGAVVRDDTSGTLMAFLDPVAGLDQGAVDSGELSESSFEGPLQSRDAQEPHAPEVTRHSSMRSRLVVGILAMVIAAMGLFFITSQTTELPAAPEPAAAEISSAPDLEVTEPAPAAAPPPAAEPAAAEPAAVEPAAVEPVIETPISTPVPPPPPSTTSSAPTPEPPPPPEEPAASPEPPTGSAAPPPDGRIEVITPAREVWLQNAAGDQFSPGPLPAGQYTVYARFGVDSETVPSPPVQVESGQTLTLECKVEFLKCISKR